ncbi:MAG: DNA-formamidopyrimidine glycosylase [cyanobacterium endosymbiont of Rhopalodia musculus]|uniref:DNA-formamidopyrimidine glycosylase n=1 Tax=cyanobacterium endosymbiont of Epithemia clementina EcSB TaxID=3034674 RepID=UPI00248100A3|nr:DNA-formamidopyrimidine glycosylase [cyanobacterium endosymbiont of Epithemia clementina EcSB]WGT67907.1 DNA-formamidopyrimidine glycosylase [cyanobacterium endosymbiont of Epithemia clementina EcSB]
MPELPEVETVCQDLNRLTLGTTIQGGEILLNRTLAYPLSVTEFLTNIVNVTVNGWERRGKYLLGKLRKESGKNGGFLGFHLRMTGQLLWLNELEPLQNHTRLRLFCGSGQELRFVDIRTFGRLWLVPPNQNPEIIITGLKKLGPEPFSEEFSLGYLTEKSRISKRNIKALLLDQGTLAGLGNIYVDEALFKSGIRPTTIAKNLNCKQLQRLRISIVEVLKEAIEKRGTTFRNFRGVTGINGNYGKIAWVYGRTGEPCRVCGITIERVKLGGRSTHFCPQCQR